MNRTTVAPLAPAISTTEATGATKGAKASFGLTGLLIFVIILVILIIVKKKCRKPSVSRSASKSEFEASDEISDVFVQEDRFVRHTQSWVDAQGNQLKAAIKTVLIDSRCLQLQRIIGKGIILTAC
jgi:hypothetical protein